MGRACCDSPREWVRGSVIGVGAFGTVNLAMDKATGELLAVKSIECKEGRKGEVMAMENEINILRKLDSPWIVKFLGENCSEDDGVCRRNLLMEYIAGGSVADVVQRFGGKLEESVIRIYTRGIVKGIEYLHNQGIVHCDIKGKNVLVGSSGVKLADFGSAKAMASEEESRVELSGTPLWMAPEMVNQLGIGPPCDIWSVGCTVVEMASGRPPWTNISHPLVAMYKIGCSDELPEFPKTLSAEGHDFLEKCLQRDPNQRWTSAQLLTHRFLSECSNQVPESPTSTLNFHNTEKQLEELGSFVTLSETIPLSVHREEKRVFEESPSPRLRASPRQRIAELAETIDSGSKSSSNRPSLCLSPASNWIVVRSLTDNKPPMLATSFSDFVNESFALCVPSSQISEADCNANSPGTDLKDESSVRNNSENFVVDDLPDKSLRTNMSNPVINLSSSTSNDPIGSSHGFCSSLTLTLSCKKLSGPESSLDVVGIPKKKHGSNASREVLSQ